MDNRLPVYGHGKVTRRSHIVTVSYFPTFITLIATSTKLNISFKIHFRKLEHRCVLFKIYYFCLADICPVLHPPINGALSCAKVGANKYCTISCNAEYGYPRGYTSRTQYVCSDTGHWLSSPPDCATRSKYS